jgi:hypothetical protein
MRTYFALLVLIFFSLNAHAKVQKWVDAEGNVHYSDTIPPEDTEARAVHNFTGKGQAGTPGYTPKTVAEREAELKKNKQGKEDAAQKQAEQDKLAETKKSNCAAARENARVLEESPRIVTYDEKGERTFIDDAARAQRLEEARKVISDSCN